MLLQQAAYGIIIQNIIDLFKKAKRTKNSAMLWVQLVIDCWLSTVYKLIWIERCIDLKKSKDSHIANKRKSQSEPYQTIKKIKLINISNISLRTSNAKHPMKISLNNPQRILQPIVLIRTLAKNPQKIRLVQTLD